MRLRSLLLAASLAASCKCAEKPAPQQQPPGSGPMQLVPQTDATLSVLETEGPACAWKRTDPVSHLTATVAALPGSCADARVAWSADGRRGLIALARPVPPRPGASPDDDAGVAFDVFEVAFADGHVRPLGGPVDGVLDDLGFDAQGRVLALMLDVPHGDEAPKELRYEGRTYALEVGAEGVPALAHAFVLEGSTWRHLETVATSVGWDEAAGTAALEAWKTLGARSTQLVEDPPAGEPVADEALVARLEGACRGIEDDGRWVQVATPPLYLFEVAAEFVDPTLCLVYDDGTSAKALPEADDAGLSGMAWVRGPYVLFATGEAPARLFDARTRQPVGAVKGTLVAFWPAVAPAAPPPAPK